MKKLFVLLLCIVTTIACKNKSTAEADVVLKICNFSTASVVKVKIDDSSSRTFPGTMVFTASYNGNYLISINTLRSYFQKFDTILTYASHGNVSVVDIGTGSNLAIMPKHLFDKQIVNNKILEDYGMSVSKIGDIVVVPIKKDQGSIRCKIFSTLIPEKLNGSKCVIRALNCGHDAIIYKYEISGEIQYLNNDEKNAIFEGAIDSFGNSPEMIKTDGLYVVKVPNELFPEIPGMSGASAIVNIDGEDYFFGMNIRRFQTRSATKGDENFTNTMMVLQPVTKSDFNF